jgi:ribosome-binding protein aMBF1 (putative translation factor)
MSHQEQMGDMDKNKVVNQVRRTGPRSPEELKRLKEIRQKVRKEFPPRDPPRLQPARDGVGSRIRTARENQGLTWYAVAKRAGIPNPSTVRDIEYGRDTKLSSVQAVAKALGLKLELLEA